MKKKDLEEAILSALQGSTYKWRTARGISKDLQVPVSQVVEILERSSNVIRSKKANSSGQPLYTTRHKYSVDQSLLDRVISAITNEPS